MSILLNDNLNFQAPKAADARYGPYADTTTALSSIISGNRFQGLVVGINGSGSIVEYWFRDGIADVNLIVKVDSTANNSSANTIYIQGVDNTQNSWISSNQAFTQAAYDQANTTAGGLLTANANIVVLQGVNTTQNNWISANQSYFQGVSNAGNTALSSNISFIAGVNSVQNTLIQQVYNTANIGSTFVNTGGTVTGNVSINGNLTVTGNVTSIGNVNNIMITGNTGQFFGNSITGFGALYAGVPTGYKLAPYSITQIVGNVYGGSAYLDVQNINADTSSSTDVTATADNGNFNDTYVDMGITSSTYNNPSYSLYGPNDGYVIVSGNTITNGGNLILNTYTAKDIIFAINGSLTSNEVARFKYNTGLVLKYFPITFADGTTQNTAAASLSYSQSAFNQANVTAGGLLTANANIVYLQGGLNSANANIGILYGINTTQNNWISANQSYFQGVSNAGNTALSSNISFIAGVQTTQNNWISSNQAFTQAAYNQANTTAGGLLTANVNIVVIQGVNTTQNSWISSNQAFTQAAYDQANTTAGGLLTANANIVVIQGVNTTQNSWISSNQVFTQAAFNQANTTSGGLLTANANIVVLQGVNTTQNNWISSNQAFTQAAFNQANTKASNTGYTANTIIFANTAGNINTSSNLQFFTSNNNLYVANSIYVNNLYYASNGNVISTGGTSGISASGLLNNSVLYANTLGYLSNTGTIQFFTSNNTLVVSNISVPTLYTTANGITFPDGTTQNTAGISVDSQARSNTVYLQGVNTTQNNWISSNQAFTQAAYDQANTTAGGLLTANSNIIIIQGVDNTQNATIIAVNNYATSAYNTANAAVPSTSGSMSGTLYVNSLSSNTSVTVNNDRNITSNTYTTSTTSQVTIDSWSSTTYRTAKYIIQMTSSATYHVIELLLLHNGTSAYITQYGEMFTFSSLGSFDASISGSTLNLLFTPTNAATTVKLMRDCITV